MTNSLAPGTGRRPFPENPKKYHSARSGFLELLPIERQLIHLHTSWEKNMRKIATLALAAGLSIAALAPAAFANQGECTGKQFANAIQTAQELGNRGQEKKAWASDHCLPPSSPVIFSPLG
ncbi:MAG: hypothetical protein JJE47_09480 [Acidimicrobiia bacterium]|nr:hypothetical protein [Acidimicrobiia bacterium]